MTFDSSADVGAWDDDELGNPLLRGGRGTTGDDGFVDDGSENYFPSDASEEDASGGSRSSDERGRLGDDDEWAANRAQILGREGAFLHMRDEGEREGRDGDSDVFHHSGRVSDRSAPTIRGTIGHSGVEQPPLLGRDRRA